MKLNVTDAFGASDATLAEVGVEVLAVCVPGVACNTGLPGTCADGLISCLEGGEPFCNQQVGQTADICDGLDNDCDGTTDENTDVITSCGLGECSANGVIACVGGVQQEDTCVVGTPVAELCDGLDNDCNGTLDNGVDDGMGGVCQAFVYGTAGNLGSLLTVSTSTGDGVVAMSFESGGRPSLAIDTSIGFIYAGNGGGNSTIDVADLATGGFVASLNTGLGFGGIGGLDFSPDGTLYASVNIAGNGGTGSDHLATIDLSTGLATVIGPFGFCDFPPPIPADGSGACDNEGMEGIAFAPTAHSTARIASAVGPVPQASTRSIRRLGRRPSSHASKTRTSCPRAAS